MLNYKVPISIARFRNFRRWKFTTQLLFIEISLWLLVAKLLHRFIPFRIFKKILGKPISTTSINYSPSKPDLQFDLIKKVTQSACSFIPGATNCYVQAIAMKIFLRWRRLSAITYIGVFKTEKEILKGHAWICHQDIVLTGDYQLDKYRVIARFA